MERYNASTSERSISIAELLSELRERNVKVWASGERLRYSGSADALTPELRELLTERKAEILKFLKDATAAAVNSGPVISPVNPPENAPLSFSQQRLWFINQLEPGMSVYNIPIAFRLRGALDSSALSRSLSEVVRRHEVLRSVYPSERGQPRQSVLTAEVFHLRTEDISGAPEVLREGRALQLADAEASRPFDLTADCMLRALLIKLRSDDHMLVLTMHHIASDGWSLGVFYREVSALYDAFATGRPTPLPDLPIQFRDFAHWQHERLNEQAIGERVDYWKKHLGGRLQPLELPTDFPRPAVQSNKGRIKRLALPPELTPALKKLALEENATLFMVLLAAFKVLLFRYSEQTDILIGTPVAGRDRAEVENLIGFFVNTLVIRSDLSGEPTFRELLRRVRNSSVSAFAHQELPFEKLAAELNPARSLSRSPLFQALFALYPAPESIRLQGLEVEPLTLEWRTAKFDLSLFVTESNNGLQAAMEYCSDLFEDATIARMLGQFQTLLTAAAASPDASIADLPLLTETEQLQLIVGANQTQTPYPHDAAIQQLFEAQAARTPNAAALVYGSETMSYRQLNDHANRLAHYLIACGVKPGDFVGLCIDRGFSMVIAILGILKTGAAYAPLDPTYPRERLQFMINDARIAVLVGQQHLLERLPARNARLVALDTQWDEIDEHSRANPPCLSTAESLAYVMYTSGSTGQPKGVMIPHRGVVRLVKNTSYASFGAEEVFLLAAPIGFDASTFELWGSLLNGGLLAIPPAGLLSLREISEAIDHFGVTTLWLTAGLFHLMVDTNLDALKKLKQLLAGGDVLSVPHVRRVLEAAPHCRLINGYGPTENTTFSCCHTINESELTNSVPIGRPISNTQVYILDRRMKPTPVGVPGELYIGGDGLATGYLNRPELTAERFVPNPFGGTPGARLYKTGDRARYRNDGAIEFLGRQDYQVKIRGFRIELDEIAAGLNQHHGVRESVAAVFEPSPGDKRLAAYFVSKNGSTPPAEELKKFLLDKLPAWMVPSVFVELDALPLNANGKVDRQALPKPSAAQSAQRIERARNPVEAELTLIWEDLLNTAPIGIRDNFFDLGGHSLLAVRMMSRIEELYAKKLPLSELFAAPNIEHLAQSIIKRADGDYDPPLIRIQDGTRTPFFFLHGDILGGGLYCWNLVRHLDRDLPFYILTPQGLEGRPMLHSIEAMAEAHLKAMRVAQPHGPYRLGGTCNGGMLAWEIARQLSRDGEQVEALLILDAWAANYKFARLHSLVEANTQLLRYSGPERVECFLRWRRRWIRTQEFLHMPLSQQALKGARGVKKLFRRSSQRFSPAPPPPPGAAHNAEERKLVLEQYRRLLSAYVPRPLPLHVDLILTVEDDQPLPQDERESDWRKLTRSLKLYHIPGEHASFTTRNLPILGQILTSCLKAAETRQK